MGADSIKKPKVFISLDLVAATLSICSREEIFRNVDKAGCVKMYVIGVVCVWRGERGNNYSKGWQIIPLREKTVLG